MLIDYLEIVGQASGKEILEWMGRDWDPTELYTLVEAGTVSSTFGGHGTRYFRYPALDLGIRVEENHLEMVIKKNPDLDGKQLQQVTGWSKDKLGRHLDDLLQSGAISRKKHGVSWRYKFIELEMKPLFDPSHPPLPSPKPETHAEREKVDRELDELEKQIMEYFDDIPDQDIDEIALGLDMKKTAEYKALLKAVARLSRDGYLSKIVDGETTTYNRI